MSWFETKWSQVIKEATNEHKYTIANIIIIGIIVVAINGRVGLRWDMGRVGSRREKEERRVIGSWVKVDKHGVVLSYQG